MKKNAKLFPVILCFTLFTFMLFGCSSSDSSEIKEVTSTGNTEITNNNTENTLSTQEKETVSITIEEQLLLDQAGILVTATEYVSDSLLGDGIKLLIENNSDKTVTVGCNALIVNNYMITDLFVSEIAAGKKANEVMYLSSSELKAAGIDSVGQVEIYFHVYDSISYEKIFDSDCITIQTSAFANMDSTPDNIGTELYHANGIKILGKTVDEDSFWGTAILLYCENTSGKNISISVEELSINGFMMNPLFSTTIYDGKMSLDEITIFSTDLEANNIETIEEVELKFHIYDADSYSTIADSEAITFSAQ